MTLGGEYELFQPPMIEQSEMTVGVA